MDNTYVHVPSTATLPEIKREIEEKTGIPAANQNIKVNGMHNTKHELKAPLPDTTTLAGLKNLITAYVIFPGRYKVLPLLFSLFIFFIFFYYYFHLLSLNFFFNFICL